MFNFYSARQSILLHLVELEVHRHPPRHFLSAQSAQPPSTLGTPLHRKGRNRDANLLRRASLRRLRLVHHLQARHRSETQLLFGVCKLRGHVKMQRPPAIFRLPMLFDTIVKIDLQLCNVWDHSLPCSLTMRICLLRPVLPSLCSGPLRVPFPSIPVLSFLGARTSLAL